MGFFEIIVGLQAKPEAFAGAECGGKSHAGSAGKGVLADAERREELLAQGFARVDVGQGFMSLRILSWCAISVVTHICKYVYNSFI